jgi:biofilm protein TabA
MIVDTVDKFTQYAAVNPLFQKVANYIESHDLNKLSIGKHIIDGDNLFVNIAECGKKEIDDAKLETHRKMIDIQVPLSSQETYGYTAAQNLPKGDYDETRDISFFDGRAQTYFTLSPGQFAIFFPQDGHAPGITSVGLKKAIFKVSVR